MKSLLRSVDPRVPNRRTSGGFRRGAAIAVLAFVLPGSASAAVQSSPVVVDAAAAERVAAEKAALALRLKADFDQYSAELRKAVAAYQADLTGLQQQNVPREKWPPHPNLVHFSRFEELASQDQPDALRWCLTAVGQMGFPATELADRKAEIYARLVVVHADLPWMADVARWIQADGTPAGIGFERADSLLRALIDGTTLPATRAAVLSVRATLLSTRTDPASTAELLRLSRELVEKHPDTPGGAAAKGRLFQAEYLAVGKTPPEVSAVDTDGKPLKLADYRGKVVVLDFWGFWCGACVRSLPHLKDLVKTHAGDPFALVGIATDPSLEEFQRRARDSGITWRNAWTGGTQGTWPTAWGIQRYPTVYVLDAQGVVRFVDVRGEALSRAVRSLLDEMRAPAPGATPR